MGARGDALIRVDSIWLGLEPLDMRAGTESALVRIPVMVTAESGIVTAFVNSKGCAVLSID
jgi:hypothetical protein